MRRTTVVNKRHEPFDVYIGRGSPFGNPYRIGPDGDRAEVVRKHEVDFEERMASDPAFRAAVEQLRGLRLGCFCKPLACHGDTIAAWLNSHEAQV